MLLRFSTVGHQQINGIHTPDGSQENISYDNSHKPASSDDSSVENDKYPQPNSISSSGSQNGSRARSSNRRSIFLNQGFPANNTIPSQGSPPGSTNGSANSILPPQPPRKIEDASDKFLTIALRNRTSIGHNAISLDDERLESNTPGNDYNEANDATAQTLVGRDSPESLITNDFSDIKNNPEQIQQAWKLLETKLSDIRVSNNPVSSTSSLDKSSHQLSEALLPILIKMRRELAETKQQLRCVSNVAIERVNDAERGRMVAVREAIYMKAKVRAFSQRNPDLLAKINSKRIQQIESELVTTINARDKIRSQLDEANSVSKQANDELEEYKQELHDTRQQLQEMEQMYSMSRSSNQLETSGNIAEQLSFQLAERDQQIEKLEQMLELMRTAEAEQNSTIESVLAASRAANERAHRLQNSHNETLGELRQAQSRMSDLESKLRGRGDELQTQHKRADHFEQLLNDCNTEIKALRAVISMQERSEARDKHMASLKQNTARPQSSDNMFENNISRLALHNDSDSRPGSALSFTGSTTSNSANKDIQKAYLNAQRQCVETRGKLLSVRQSMREQTDQLREMEQRLSERDKQLKDFHTRFDAFSHILSDAVYKQRDIDIQKNAGGDGKPVERISNSHVELDVNTILAIIRDPLASSSTTLPPAFDENLRPDSRTSSVNSADSSHFYDDISRSSWSYEPTNQANATKSKNGSAIREPLRSLSGRLDTSVATHSSTTANYSAY